MTNLDPKHLDALIMSMRKMERQMSFQSRDLAGAKNCRDAIDKITALRAENDRLSNLWQIEHDHATALRAQIDRERAATIEAAAEASDCGCGKDRSDCMAKKGFVSYCYRDGATDIRALHTDATRAAMDAIRREGYEAGVRDAVAKAEECGQRVAATYIGMILCGAVREWPPSRPPEWGGGHAHRDRPLLVGDRYPVPPRDPEPMRPLFEERLAAIIPPDPDTNAN